MLPARQSYFLLSLPVQHGESRSPVGCRRGAPGQTILLSLSLPVQHSKSWYLVGRRRGAPGQTNLTFSVFTCPTKQVLVSRWTRCSRPDKRSFCLLAPKILNPVERDIPGRFGKLSLQSTTGEAPPPCSQVSVPPQMPQEPPGWTTSPFPPLSAKLTHQTGGHAHQLDVG